MGQPDFNILYEAILQVKEDTGKIMATQTSQAEGLDSTNKWLKDLNDKHDNLKNDFSSHKFKLLTIGSFLGLLCGVVGTFLTKFFGGH